MWSPCLTNDTQAIHGGLGSPARPRIAILGGAKLGKMFANVPVLQENVNVGLHRRRAAAAAAAALAVVCRLPRVTCPHEGRLRSSARKTLSPSETVPTGGAKLLNPYSCRPVVHVRLRLPSLTNKLS